MSVMEEIKMLVETIDTVVRLNESCVNGRGRHHDVFSGVVVERLKSLLEQKIKDSISPEETEGHFDYKAILRKMLRGLEHRNWDSLSILCGLSEFDTKELYRDIVFDYGETKC